MNFFIEVYPNKNLEIIGDDFNHLKAQRKRVGELLTIIPTKGNKYIIYEITEIKKKSAVLKLIEEKDKPQESVPLIYLYQAIAKKQKMDVILQKATELGVNTIIPLITQNIVPQAEKSNIERWEKIVRESAMQSRRFDIPLIQKPQTLKSIKVDKNMCCLAEKSAERSFRNYLEEIKIPDKLGIIIGAEGGFTKEELFLLREKGVALISFGRSILRTETAAISALGVLRWFFD